MSLEFIRNFQFDTKRKAKVNQDWFRYEYLALLGNDAMAGNYKEAYESGKKLGNQFNSTVGYVMGITDVLPTAPPPVHLEADADIDLDFADEDRHKVFEYLEHKYGKEHVSKLGTVALLKSRSAMALAGKALGIPSFEYESLLNSVEQYAAGDERNAMALADSLTATKQGKALLAKHPALHLVARFGGAPSHSSTHAAGALLTKEPMVNYVATDSLSGATHLDKKDAEELGLLKLDCLGLKTLSIYESALKMAGLSRDHLYSLPFDDSKTYEVLNKGHISGIFQFEGKALSVLAKEVTIENLNDISTLSALARPGPLASGAAHDWAFRRSGGKWKAKHECVAPYLSDTMGVLVFQETLMLIAREVCGMPWSSVSKLRKAVAKSMGDDAMKPFSEPFVNGLVARGMELYEAETFWREVIGFGKYSFCQAHSIPYAVISYWGAWLKAHYPLEFAAASLQRKDADAQLTYLRELDEEGITYTPVDGELSGAKWQVVNGNLVGPITLIKGIGPKMSQTILSARARGEPLSDRAAKLLANPVTDIDELYPVQKMIKSIGLSNHNILEEPTKIADIEPDGTWQDDVLVVGVVDVCKVRDENEAKRIEDRIGRGQNGKMTGQTKFLELRVRDDSGTYYCKIGRNDFGRLAPQIQSVFEEGLTVIAVRGTITPQAPVLLVKKLKVLK